MDIETSVIYLSQIVEFTITINWGTFSWIHEPKIWPPSLPTPGNIWQEVMVWVATILSLWYYKSQALFIIAWLHCKGKQLLPDTCLQQQKSQICSAPGELLLQKTRQTCDTNTIKFITSINDLSICYYHSLSLVDFRTFMTVKFCAKYSNLLDYILSVT